MFVILQEMEVLVEFKLNDLVYKPKGYFFEGIVIGVIRTTENKVRYIVENPDGIIHIFSGSQLKKTEYI